MRVVKNFSKTLLLFCGRIGVAKASEVSLVDRVLLLGQRVEDQVGNIGTIVDYEVSATVQINGTQDVVEKIPLHRLRPISVCSVTDMIK